MKPVRACASSSLWSFGMHTRSSCRSRSVLVHEPGEQVGCRGRNAEVRPLSGGCRTADRGQVRKLRMLNEFGARESGWTTHSTRRPTRLISSRYLGFRTYGRSSGRSGWTAGLEVSWQRASTPRSVRIPTGTPHRRSSSPPRRSRPSTVLVAAPQAGDGDPNLPAWPEHPRPVRHSPICLSETTA